MPSIADSSGVQTPDQKMRGALIRYQVLESDIGYVSLIGRLDVRSVPQIEEEFQNTVVPPQKPLIVDLSGVELMNSVGLGLLIVASDSLNVHGIPVVLLNPQPKVERVIRMACVDALLPITHSLADALKVLKANAHGRYIFRGDRNTSGTPASPFGPSLR